MYHAGFKFLPSLCSMETEKLALRSGSSKHGKTFLASIDCSCEAAKYLKVEKNDTTLYM